MPMYASFCSTNGSDGRSRRPERKDTPFPPSAVDAAVVVGAPPSSPSSALDEEEGDDDDDDDDDDDRPTGAKRSNVVCTARMALRAFQNSMTVMRMEKIWMEFPDIHSIKAFMGTLLAGDRACVCVCVMARDHE
jgi:hypothetical protein